MPKANTLQIRVSRCHARAAGYWLRRRYRPQPAPIIGPDNYFCTDLASAWRVGDRLLKAGKSRRSEQSFLLSMARDDARWLGGAFFYPFGFGGAPWYVLNIARACHDAFEKRRGAPHRAAQGSRRWIERQRRREIGGRETPIIWFRPKLKLAELEVRLVQRGGRQRRKSPE